MTDRPIIFSGAMVRALLAGRKTMTRRLAWREITTDTATGAVYGLKPSPWQRVKPGDRLWVRETAWIPPHPDSISERDLRDGADTWRPSYHADGPDDTADRYKEWGWKLRSSIHMPRWASRLTLTVTAARVERLQDISEADAEAEGLWRGRARRHLFWVNSTACRLLEGQSHRAVFGELWDSLHGPGAWDANPEVVALTFTVAHRNIDSHAREQPA